MMFTAVLRAVVLMLVMLTSVSVSVAVQAESGVTNMSMADIQAARERVSADSGLDADAKSKADELLQKAEVELNAAAERATQLKSQVETARNADALVLTLDQQLRAVEQDTAAPIVATGQTASALEVLIAEQRALRANVSDLEGRKTGLESRAAAIAEELIAARSQLADLQDGIASSPVNISDWSANQIFAAARQSNLTALISDLEAELSTLPARQPVMTARIALAEAKLQRITQQIEQLQSKLADSRLVLANESVRTAQSELQALTNASPALQSLATENLELAKQLSNLATQASQVITTTTDLQSEMKNLAHSRETVERVLATGLVTDELVDVLRQMRSSLPKIDPLQQIQTHNQSAQTIQQLNMILWQNQLRDLQDMPMAIATMMTAQGIDLSPADSVVAQRLMQSRIVILQALVAASIAQSDRLVAEGLAVTDVLQNTNDLIELLDRRLLWLPSRTGLNGGLLDNVAASTRWFGAPSHWQGLAKDLKTGIMQAPFVAWAILILPWLLLGLRRLLKNSLSRLGDRVGNVNHDTYGTTPLAIGATVLLALPLPLFLAALATVILISPAIGVFSHAMATGLATTSSLLLILNVFRNMCRPDGLFADHFAWQPVARQRLSRNLMWFNGVLCCSTLVFFASMSTGLSELRYGFGLISFMTSAVAISVFCFQFFKPKRGIASAIVVAAPAPLMLLAWPLTTLAPISTGLLPLFGFFDTAVELQSRLFRSGISLFLAAVTYGLLLRLYGVAQRRYTLRKLMAQRDQAEAERQSSTEAQVSGDAIPAAASPVQADVAAIGLQTRRTLRTLVTLTFFAGLWMIWSPLLPALGIANDIDLWQSTMVVNGVDVARPVTLWNVIVSILWLVGGFIAARNIGGLLEIVVFERFKLDNGERYATVTIVGYLLAGVGLVLGFSQLGIDWSKLQWIVAALGVGLGFGLQEIVANFISGLIILFERPVRVGDTVTIGTLSGTVSNIKIRATTITDFDNREVLLPNKTIITENVTNWTLNDAVTRVVILIGVAYGSEIEQVRELLMAVITAHPDVLETPPPTVFFIAHGESSLDFEVRVFVGSTLKRMPVTHDINAAINAALNANGIDIPFPHRTINIIS